MARIILNGSSLYVISGLSGVLSILLVKSFNPLKGSSSFPKLFLDKPMAIALIVKSRLF